MDSHHTDLRRRLLPGRRLVFLSAGSEREHHCPRSGANKTVLDPINAHGTTSDKKLFFKNRCFITVKTAAYSIYRVRDYWLSTPWV
ncbi:hypothetical protein [Robbsia sp. KACC 23696]|uniref:hypothetical protein n=1 Tax=Robbsia sp. KACC 23696 TaxID=3149231 RepID=UPI00325BB4AF